MRKSHSTKHMQESDIMHSNGRYSVVKGHGLNDDDVRVPAYEVIYSDVAHSAVAVAAFNQDADGLSLAIVSADYKAQRNPVMSYEMFERLRLKPILVA